MSQCRCEGCIWRARRCLRSSQPHSQPRRVKFSGPSE